MKLAQCKASEVHPAPVVVAAVPATVSPPARGAGSRLCGVRCWVVCASLAVVALLVCVSVWRANNQGQGECGGDAPTHGYDWALVFEDNFDTLDHSVWNVADNTTHASIEQQLYVQNAVEVRDGNLVITTQRDPSTCRAYGSKRNYTSGWVDTKGKFSSLFGRWEVRARLPNGTHFPRVWPAFWMMPEPDDTVPPNLCWPAGGEIDIMEMWGGTQQSRSLSHLHWSRNNQCGASADHNTYLGKYPLGPDPPIDFSADFHTWLLEWDADTLSVSVDNVFIGSLNSSSVLVPATRFHWILNTAICSASWCYVGSEWADGDKAEMFVDYVRVYEQVEWMV